MLGETLVRQEGRHLLELVERVRSLAKAIRSERGPGAVAELDAILAAQDIETLGSLVRAFTTYFYLANAAEQVHRVDSLSTRSETTRWGLRPTLDRVLQAGQSPATVAATLADLEVRPVFTAHPTEAARRSILSKLSAITALIERRTDPRVTQTEIATIDRRTAELIDLIWQTDELRRARPTPVDEARSAIYYLEQISGDVFSGLGDTMASQMERLGETLEPSAAPLRFGTWVGGDRDGNPFVTPDVTRRVLADQHDHGLMALIGAVERVADDLSTSIVVVEMSAALEKSLEADRVSLPETWDRFSLISAGEPYRLKLAYVHERLKPVL